MLVLVPLPCHNLGSSKTLPNALDNPDQVVSTPCARFTLATNARVYCSLSLASGLPVRFLRFLIYVAVVIVFTAIGEGIGFVIGVLTCVGLHFVFVKKPTHAYDDPFSYTGEGADESQGNYLTLANIQFFEIFGHLCKIDGVVSRDEIEGVEVVFRHLSFNEMEREEAIDAFRRGKEPDFDFEGALEQLQQTHFETIVASQLLHLLNVVVANIESGGLVREERAMLNRIGSAMGLQPEAINDILTLGQRQWGQGTHTQPGAEPKSTIALAYESLELDEDASVRQIERAYRKLRSRHHPDKLLRSASDEEREATEKRFKDVQKAWDVLRVHHNL